jgi:GTP pyrophosphokinase
MQAGGLTLKQIQDIFALRVIVGEEQHCYQALEAVHQHFQVEPLRFRDYIRSPKPNGYQSIHTCVRNGQGWGFEIQIRSVDMHRQADDGAAAHWRYTADQQGEFLAQREKPGLLGRLRARLGR